MSEEGSMSALDTKRFSNVTVTAGSEPLLISHLISEEHYTASEAKEAQS